MADTGIWNIPDGGLIRFTCQVTIGENVFETNSEWQIKRRIIITRVIVLESISETQTEIEVSTNFKDYEVIEEV